MAGRSGSSAERFAVVTPSARSLPALTCCSTSTIGLKLSCSLPETRVGRDRCTAAIGHVPMERSARKAKTAAARCSELPEPPEP